MHRRGVGQIITDMGIGTQDTTVAARCGLAENNAIRTRPKLWSSADSLGDEGLRLWGAVRQRGNHTQTLVLLGKF